MFSVETFSQLPFSGLPEEGGPPTFSEDVEGVAAASETAYEVVTADIVDEGAATESGDTITIVSLVDTASAAEVVEVETSPGVVDAAAATEHPMPQGAATMDVVEAPAAAEAVSIAFRLDVADAATAADTADLAEATTLVDAAAATDTLTPQGVGGRTVLDLAIATDTVFTVQPTDIDEAAAAGDMAFVETGLSLVDSAQASEDAYPTGESPPEEVVDTFAAADWMSAQQDTQMFVEEQAGAYDAVFHRTDTQAWVLNTESGAPSNYSNWPMLGMASYAGETYAVGPAGVYRVGAEEDDGDSILWRVKWSGLDFGTPYKKRMSAIWVTYASSRPLTVLVTPYDQSMRARRYVMERRVAVQERTNRIPVGKGMLARHWDVELRNTAPTEVGAAGAEIYDSSRRM